MDLSEVPLVDPGLSKNKFLWEDDDYFADLDKQEYLEE